MRVSRFDRRKSDEDVLYDTQPYFDFRFASWVILELVLKADGKLIWRYKIEPIPDMNPALGRMVTFLDEEDATRAARDIRAALNLGRRVNVLAENGDISTHLRVSKAVVSFERHMEEEALMLLEAKRRHIKAPRSAEIDLDGDPAYRSEILSLLSEMPYLRIVLVGERGGRALYRSQDGKAWTRVRGELTDRGTEIAARARIAQGFGLSPFDHWGRTKARIRAMLLPRANQLLQLASVRRLLDDALQNGERMLVIGQYAFWYESDGSVGWVVKEIAEPSIKDGASAEGEAIWEAGTVLSKNHGRIIVLPFRKSNGEPVQGHTRNAAGDGPAKPRHQSEYLTMPFRRLHKDKMIGLFGELPYE